MFNLKGEGEETFIKVHSLILLMIQSIVVVEKWGRESSNCHSNPGCDLDENYLVPRTFLHMNKMHERDSDEFKIQKSRTEIKWDS